MEVGPTPRKEKKGLGKLWNKIKLAIRPKSRTKSTSSVVGISSTQTLQPLTTLAPQRSQSTEPEGLLLPSSQSPNLLVPLLPPLAEMQQDSRPISDSHEPAESTSRLPSTQLIPGPTMTSNQKDELARRYERAQVIFAKYSLELDEVSWEMHPKSQTERVHKNIRLRVRWTCHECKTTFGRDRVCDECAHHRCKSCVRYPPKRGRTNTTKRSTIVVMADRPNAEAKDGTCHECQTHFSIGSLECSNCHHTICERCLHELLSTAEQGEAHAVVTA